MGIKGLWQTLGDGEVIAIADLAAEHFKKTGRPLRIAVDEATWRYHLPPAQEVARICAEQKEGYFHPEKTLFYRMVPLLTLGIRLLFVFDGPHRPIKRQNLSGQAPLEEQKRGSEAEAECASLQSLEIVDAVWTEDSDCLMFGCTLLIRGLLIPQPGTRSRQKIHARLYRSQLIREHCGLDQDGLILFAVLSGGDYATAGLPGCGRLTALKAAQEGLGKAFCAEDYHQPRWKAQLIQFLRRHGSLILPEKNFPLHSVRQNYMFPKVSSLHRLQKVRIVHEHAVNQQALAELLATRFNIWVDGYMKLIAPILLVRNLLQSSPGQEGQLIQYFGVKLVRQRKNVTPDAESVVKLSFLPAQISLINHKTKMNAPWAPGRDIQLETLRCVLESAFPSMFPHEAQLANPMLKRPREHSDSSTSEHPIKRGSSGFTPSSVKSFAPMSSKPSGLPSSPLPTRLRTSELYPRSPWLEQPLFSNSSLSSFLTPSILEHNDMPPCTDTCPAEQDVDINDALLASAEDHDLERAIALSLAERESQPLSSSDTMITEHSPAPLSMHYLAQAVYSSPTGLLGLDRKHVEEAHHARLGRTQQAETSRIAESWKLTNLISKTSGDQDMAKTRPTQDVVFATHLGRNPPVRTPLSMKPKPVDVEVIDLTND